MGLLSSVRSHACLSSKTLLLKAVMILTHWGRVTHICVSELTIIGSNNGLSHGRRQAIIWTNAAILLIGHLETNFSEILIKIHTFSFKKMRLKMSSGKWRPSCLGLYVLRYLPEILWHNIWYHESDRYWQRIRSAYLCRHMGFAFTRVDQTALKFYINLSR